MLERSSYWNSVKGSITVGCMSTCMNLDWCEHQEMHDPKDTFGFFEFCYTAQSIYLNTGSILVCFFPPSASAKDLVSVLDVSSSSNARKKADTFIFTELYIHYFFA